MSEQAISNQHPVHNHRTVAREQPQQHHNKEQDPHHKHRKEAQMTSHSNKYFPESKPTGWTQRNFPNQSNRLLNRVWRKQQK